MKNEVCIIGGKISSISLRRQTDIPDIHGHQQQRAIIIRRNTAIKAHHHWIPGSWPVTAVIIRGLYGGTAGIVVVRVVERFL